MHAPSHARPDLSVPGQSARLGASWSARAAGPREIRCWETPDATAGGGSCIPGQQVSCACPGEPAAGRRRATPAGNGLGSASDDVADGAPSDHWGLTVAGRKRQWRKWERRRGAEAVGGVGRRRERKREWRRNDRCGGPVTCRPRGRRRRSTGPSTTPPGRTPSYGVSGSSFQRHLHLPSRRG